MYDPQPTTDNPNPINIRRFAPISLHHSPSQRIMNTDKFPLDFLILGTMKSGTSSLSTILQTHPALGIPTNEVHYFDLHFSKGKEWYRAILEAERSEETILLGEKTPNYTWDEKYLTELQKLTPNVKLIWIFRNPAERAYSHFNHNLHAGRENLSFEEALHTEAKRVKTDSHYGYRSTSAYATHVKRALKYFPIEQMHFLTLESFKTNTKEEITKIFKFLSVDPSIAASDYAHSHKTQIPRYPLLRYNARKWLGYESRLWNLYYSKFMPKEPQIIPKKLHPDQREKLMEGFANEISELTEITGLDTSVWK